MERVQPGYVIVLRKGLKVYDVAAKTTRSLEEDTTVIVESAREVMANSEDDGIETGFVADARALRADGSYDSSAPVMTFAQYGSYREEFTQLTFTVLRKMRRTWVAWD
jgi:hypothetical protein